jgi:hypothetical protein
MFCEALGERKRMRNGPDEDRAAIMRLVAEESAAY